MIASLSTPPLLHVCQWIYNTPFSISIRESVCVFPIIESVHVLGITVLVGTVAIFDLRLLGIVMKQEPVSAIARQVLPWSWGGFPLMFVTGLLLSIAETATNYYNLVFRIKLVLLVLVGVNPLIFHLSVFRKVSSWDLARITPFRARVAATFSLLLWGGIIVADRMIAYLEKP